MLGLVYCREVVELPGSTTLRHTNPIGNMCAAAALAGGRSWPYTLYRREPQGIRAAVSEDLEYSRDGRFACNLAILSNLDSFSLASTWHRASVGRASRPMPIG